MRRGQFVRAAIQYGQAISIVKPPDNDPGSYIAPELSDTALALTLAQQNDLQARINDLYAIMREEREYFT